MNLRWITLFATIAEEGSFTRAATKLNIAQPWLSAQLRKLEYELGVQLLVRENVGVRVTDAGKRLLPHAQQLAESAHLFRENARSLSETWGKVVKLGGYLPIIDVPDLKSLTLDFAARYGNFDLNTLTASPADLIKALDDCTIDLALIPSELTGSGPELECRPVGKANVYLLAPKDRKLSRFEDVRGLMVGVPPRQWGPRLHGELALALEGADATPSEVPEFDRRAVEHSVVTRGAIVAIPVDDRDIASIDPKISALRLDWLSVEHMLCRVANRDLGRAADRFWMLSECKADEPALKQPA